MKTLLRYLVDLFDIIAVLSALGAVYFVFTSMAGVATGPEFMQIGLFGLMLAVIPYCLAGAVHRIWQRTP